MQADDERPIKKLAHVMGQDLGSLSVDELEERIQLLHEEIARLEGAISSKSATKAAAEGLFRLG